MKTQLIALAGLFFLCGNIDAQKKKGSSMNDSNSPLHLMQPEYKVPYGVISEEDVKKDIDRVLNYIENNTTARVVHNNTVQIITD